MSSEIPRIEADLTGRTAIVTGANTGVGKEVARNLARMGARVILACRSAARGEAACREIIGDTGNEMTECLLVDVSSQAAIRAFVNQFLKRHDALHILVNNAGIYPARRELSVDGIEMTWATNVLAYHLLAKLLLGMLTECAPARIVNVASCYAGNLDMTDLQFERRTFWGHHAYRQSKQANRMLSWVLAQRLEGKGVTVNVATPGWVDSEITRYQRGVVGFLVRASFRINGKHPALGADTPTWLAASPDVEGISGKFWASRRELPREFYNPTLQNALWNICESQILIPEPITTGSRKEYRI